MSVRCYIRGQTPDVTPSLTSKRGYDERLVVPWPFRTDSPNEAIDRIRGAKHDAGADAILRAAPDDLAPVIRWTAPADDTIRVFGKLKKESKQGNGVHGWIVSSTRGILKDVLVAPASEQLIGLGKLEVKKGETLSFAVGSEGDTNSDSFNWVPEIHRLNADGTTTFLTNAKADFCGKDGWPMNRAKPQSPLSQLAQVLMMSNEFQFVD